MTRGLGPLALAAALLAAPAPAAAAELGVGMPSRVFLPTQLQAVVGDTVVWHNRSDEPHDVNARDGSFGSGRILPGESFAQRFDAPASVPYLCLLHPSVMTGRLDVVPVALSGPAHPVAAGEPAELTGRAPAGTSTVVVEDAGGRRVTTVAPDADGSFRAAVRPESSTAYRAVAPNGASPHVPVGVVDRVRLPIAVSLGRRLVRVRVRTDPARPGATAVLQLYVPDRFAWRRVARGTLDSTGRVVFTLPARVRRRARVVLLREGRPVATSRAVATWRLSRPGRRPRPAHGPHA